MKKMFILNELTDYCNEHVTIERKVLMVRVGENSYALHSPSINYGTVEVDDDYKVLSIEINTDLFDDSTDLQSFVGTTLTNTYEGNKPQYEV